MASSLRSGAVSIALTLIAFVGPLYGQQPVQLSESRATESPAALSTPSDYLGFSLGTDFRLAGWEAITGYFNHLANGSELVQVDTLGRTTLGRPFILVTITAAQSFARLDEIRQNQAKLADPRKLEDGELAGLLATQPAVVFISHNIHSTEIASSQGVMELAYTFASDTTLAGALREVVVLIVPSVNPDGQQMVVDWYQRTLGTPYEGSRMPWLYHHYVGHDNNRDFFMLTQVETQLVNDLLYSAWFPEVVYDVHQMGNRGARFFIPPFDDPANPNLDPLVVRMISLLGTQISTDLEAAGKSGVVNYERFDLWWHGGLRTVPARHNMVGLLSETASARLASPIFQEFDEIDRAPQRGVHYPNPWPGGWWRIRDIIDYQLIASRSVVEFAARQRRQLIRNYVELGRRATEAGSSTPPVAYIVPTAQRDPGSAAVMLELIRRGGVQVHRATAPFAADGLRYAPGDWVVLMAQPYRAHVKDLLERQAYPDRRVFPGGPPDTPYDVAGWTLPLQMGVTAVEVKRPFEADLRLEAGPIRPPAGQIRGTGSAFLLDNSTNAANLAIHRAHAAGADVALLAEPVRLRDREWLKGSVMISGQSARELLTELATTHGLSAESFSRSAVGFRIRQPRVGLYQPWTASMDEGWTRYVFENWDVSYSTLHDSEIRAGNLGARYDVIVLPDIAPASIVAGRATGTVPAEYVGGLGEAGVAAIRAFVRSGGTLVCLDSSSGFAIAEFGLPIKDVRPSSDDRRSGQTFYAPGSIFAVTIDTTHPLGYGMPEESIVYYANSPIFEVADEARGATVVARYPEQGQLLSGYAINTDFLAGKAALVEVAIGEGRAILFGFRPQHRGQSHETFKILFNAIYRSAADGPVPLEP